jgi:hypothetical protein
MKKFMSELRENRRKVYLVIFLSMIIPATLSNFAAQADNYPLMVLFLGLVVLANLITLVL